MWRLLRSVDSRQHLRLTPSHWEGFPSFLSFLSSYQVDGIGQLPTLICDAYRWWRLLSTRPPKFERSILRRSLMMIDLNFFCFGAAQKHRRKEPDRLFFQR